MIIHRQIVPNNEQVEQLGIFEYLKHSMNWTPLSFIFNFFYFVQ